MANKTTNYKLVKPLASEFYDVEVQNENMDKIDAQMKTNADSIKNLQDGQKNKADLVDGKVPAEQLPTMDYEAKGTAEQVVKNHNGSDEAHPNLLEQVRTCVKTMDAHTTNKSNPHGVTASQIGLGNADNTADADKPVSSAQAAAIADAKKEGTTALNFARNHAQNQANPHGVTAAQVGAATSAALNAHSDDRSNPHGVTAAQAGAAPAGFGLGADSVSVDSWDNATENGFYKSNKGTPDGDGNYWHGIVVNYSGVLCNQLVWKTWGTGSVMATRRINNSIPEEWEWLNPPMDTGVVYRTTRRYLGKPVYTKLIDCGTLPHNTRKNVSYGNTDPGGVGTGAPIVVIEVVAGTNDGGSFPRFSGAGNTPNFTISTYSGEMQIITTGMSGASSSKVYAQIWYTRQSM